MKRLILTFLFSIAITLAALIPLGWTGEASLVQAKVRPDHPVVISQEGQKPAAAQTGKARVWLAHLAPFATANTAVTVTVDGTDLLTGFEFGQTTPGYIAVDAGLTQIQVSKESDGTPIITETVSLMAGTDYTVAVVGTTPTSSYNQFDLRLVDGDTGTDFDNNTPPDPGQGKLRIVHFAPFTTTITGTTVAILDENDNPLNGLGDLRYGGSSNYFSLPAASYDLTVSAFGGVVTQTNSITIEDGQIVTVFAIGDNIGLGGRQPVRVLPVVYSGPEVYVAHVAPFDAITAATAVTVSVNGSAAITDFVYQETSGGYVPLTRGDNIIGVSPVTGPMAISDTFNLTSTKYTIAAIGDITNQPLELLQLVDEEPVSTTAKVRIVHAAPFSTTLAGTEVDIRDEADNVVDALTNVRYKDSSGYLPLPADTYDLKVTAPGGGAARIDIPPLTVKDGDIVTIFAIGDGAKQALDLLSIPPEFLQEQGMPTLYLPVVLKSAN